MTGWPASRASAAASRNVRSMRWLQRSTSALNSSDFVGKRRNRYACEMPAALAISVVGVPWKPCSANAATAASTSTSRRSAAVRADGWQAGGSFRGEYALTHSLRQGRNYERRTAKGRRRRSRTRGVPGRETPRARHGVRGEEGHRRGGASRSGDSPAPERDALVGTTGDYGSVPYLDQSAGNPSTNARERPRSRSFLSL